MKKINSAIFIDAENIYHNSDNFLLFFNTLSITFSFFLKRAYFSNWVYAKKELRNQLLQLGFELIETFSPCCSKKNNTDLFIGSDITETIVTNKKIDNIILVSSDIDFAQALFSKIKRYHKNLIIAAGSPENTNLNIKNYCDMLLFTHSSQKHDVDVAKIKEKNNGVNNKHSNIVHGCNISEGLAPTR